MFLVQNSCICRVVESYYACLQCSTVSEYLSYVPISGPVRPDLVMANTLSTNIHHQHQHQIQRRADRQFIIYYRVMRGL